MSEVSRSVGQCPLHGDDRCHLLLTLLKAYRFKGARGRHGERWMIRSAFVHLESSTERPTRELGEADDLVPNCVRVGLTLDSVTSRLDCDS